LFGTIILLFSTALAYFTANYLSTNNMFDYWGTIAIFACAYVVIGIGVSMIFAISLGFLFSADILILNLLLQYYGQWADVVKLTMIGGILIILYVATAMWLKDKPDPQTAELPQTNY
jgi:hypothetical protein